MTNSAPFVDAGPDVTKPSGDMTSLAPATFADPGVADTHTALVDWNDGAVDAGTVIESGGFGDITGSHTYATARRTMSSCR